MNDTSKLVKINEETHETLRRLSFEQRKPMKEIVEEAVKSYTVENKYKTIMDYVRIATNQIDFVLNCNPEENGSLIDAIQSLRRIERALDNKEID